MAETDCKAQRFSEVIARYPRIDGETARALIEGECRANSRKIIVLDDDPTGIQTVHGVSVYTDWTDQSIEAGFDEASPIFFILTNSRGMTAAETAAAHREIGASIARTSAKKQQEFIIISRSDSTLRGHYPLETESLKNAAEAQTGKEFDGEIICPFFLEGGRLTAENIHYVKTGDVMVPAAQTEFAKDRTFGYRHSDLAEWVEEKTNGAFKKE
ncbi:MAG: hydroxyacid dehydrogenase, partial [Treponema sp.]|nr:hydroxyacid dehydrogenase [Treponema sp.]